MKRSAWWSVLLVLLLLAAACGGDGGEEQAADGATDEPATEEPATEGAEEPATEGTAAEESDTDASCTELEGETISFVVPFSAGGGYDTYARMMAPYLEEQLGATVVVENNPGAGGLLAINNLLTKSGDGTTIAIMNAVGSGGAVIAGAEGAQFGLDQLTYLGRVVEDRPVVISAANGPYDTFEQVLEADDVRLGAVGPGSQDFITAVVLNALFPELQANVITGFEGSEEVDLTLLQGDLDVTSGSLSSHIASIESGDEQPLLLMAREPAEELPDTPALLELELDEEQQQLAEAYLALLELGRAIVAPPDLDEATQACLRSAVEGALHDPELVAEAEQQDRPIDFLSGEEMDELVATVIDAPEEFTRVITEAH